MSDYNYLDKAGLTTLWSKIKSYISSLGYTTNKGTVGGSGTSGYLAKWTGTTAVGNGPQLGNSTVTFLRNDGNWAEPSGTITKIQKNGSDLTISNKTVNIIVPTSVSQLSNDSGFVTTNTTYSAGTGLSLSGTTFNHSNSVTAGTAGSTSASVSTGSTVEIPYVTYDAQGHITSTGTHKHIVPVSEGGDSNVSATVVSGVLILTVESEYEDGTEVGY